MNAMVENPDAKLALVVDDSEMQCMILKNLLMEEGYRVLTGNDGARGVALYIEHLPDLVLMDINMPVMDGYEAAKRIKSLSPNSLAPLIFITSMDSDQAFVDSIEAGGDGILTRPFSPEVFKAKIKSIQRISNLYSQVKNLQQEQQQDAELAEQIMSGVIEARNFALDRIGIIKQAAALFSGDIQLTALCPGGNVNVLLGDFTGHGLRSSIGAIPLAETFRVMTKKGFSLLEIIEQINRQLYELLPVDLFCCVCCVSISSHERSAYVFNAGLPDTYIFNHEGKIKHKITSNHIPLGVMPNLLPQAQLQVFSVASNDRVVLISDGILEARNHQGEMYGTRRFEFAAKQGFYHGDIPGKVFDAVDEFCQGRPQEDDLSLIDIPCHGWEQAPAPDEAAQSIAISEMHDLYLESEPSWKWQLKLTGQRLALVNPVPMAMGQIQEIEGNGEHWNNMYSILTELYVNALDHGILRLNSDLKNSAAGFAHYFMVRESRLKNLSSGMIDISLSYHPLQSGGKMIITIADDGAGFDLAAFYEHRLKLKQADKVMLCGRGIDLVHQLCEKLEYLDGGNKVQATYVWAK
ncbi:SpoIIE family protein phosphatase [Thalassomonas sp. RHCl1]|uniref:ATP-binding SpoIIE family protein phosphatase n=1 Tax=Thalassomonas sp. RHCl1 TaxID=2995320 RepID=UPI00248B6C51|nr:SpoIIE family protein phosphatase [Thalassomonas sp. RHCl1]